MDTIFMNPENSKMSYPHRILFILSDKINLKRSDKIVLHQVLAFTMHGKL